MVESLRCAGCGAELSENARFCGVCGQTVPSASSRPAAATILQSPPSLGAPLARVAPVSTRPRAEARILEPPVTERPRAPSTRPAAPAATVRVARPSGAVSDADRRIILGFAAFFVILGLGVALYEFFAADVSATPDFSRGEPMLEITTRNIDDGVTIDVLGQSLPIRDGHVSVEMRDDALEPGRNTIHAIVDGESYALRVDVPIVVLLDEPAIAAEPPRIGLLLRAEPDDVVTVDGHRIALDAHGVGHVSSVADGSDRIVERTYAIAVEHDGEAIERRFHIRVAPSSLAVIQPPSTLVTDRASVELDARIAAAATATLDGRPLENVAGRIHASLGLVRPGDFRYRLDVVEPGKRRRTETFLVRRVAILEQAAQGFVADASIDYAALRERSDALLGRPVSFVGRVVQLRVESGRSFVNVAVLPCEGGDGCPLRVEYPATTNFHVDELIRVRGVVARPSRTAAVVAPRVEAQFLTPEPR